MGVGVASSSGQFRFSMIELPKRAAWDEHTEKQDNQPDGTDDQWDTQTNSY